MGEHKERGEQPRKKLWAPSKFKISPEVEVYLFRSANPVIRWKVWVIHTGSTCVVLWSSLLGDYIVCKRFTVQTLF